MTVGERLRYDGAVLGDYALRTMLSSALTGVMVPGTFLGDARAEIRRLERYAELADKRDPGAVFTAPPADVRIEIQRSDGLRDQHGSVELLRFRSPHEPLNAELRRAYQRHTRNSTAQAQHWRHQDSVRQTLVVIHGFGASAAGLNAALFSLPEFFAQGWDVILFTLPFHGARARRRAPFNGSDLFAHGLSHFNEATLQAICDLRVLLDYLQRIGAPRVGVTGISLGGYVTALLAEVDARLDFAITNAAVTSIPAIMSGWFPTNLGALAMELIKHVPRELIDRSTAVHSPLTYPALIPRERLLVIGGRGDRLAPPEQSEWLWEHWGRPALHWYPGSHLLHFERASYLQAMRELIDQPRRPALGVRGRSRRRAQPGGM